MIFRKLMIFFGLCHLTVITICAGLLIATPSLFWFITLLFAIYGLPIVAFKIQEQIVPLKEGKFDFNERRYCPWWGSHQIQQVYSAIPFLEGILRIIPGVYSCWLRLWGSSVGKQVYWTPRVEIVDRSLLEIDDYVIFGHRSACSSHILSQKDKKMLLQIGKIRLGKSVLVGAGSRLGPGTQVAEKITIPICSILLIDQHVAFQEQLKVVHHDPIQRPSGEECI
jgi:hypothetical protein